MGLAVAPALCMLTAGAFMQQSAPPSPRAANGYADGSLCANCHQEIAAKYARTGMGRSFYRLRPAQVVEDFKAGKPFYHKASETYFAMIERGGRYYQRRWQIGFDGQETNLDEKQIDFVMGSGNHGRTYLHLSSRGTLQQLPLGWYAEKGGYWAMNPGYDRADYPGSTRAVHYECMFCHNAYPKIPKASEEPGAEARFLSPIPEGIDCQRCHGPGQRHIEAASRAGATADEIRGAIVNPGRLSPDRELEVCMQCHLETTTLLLPHSVDRPGRGPFSYIPGQPLADFRLSFDRAPGQNERFEVAHAAYRLRRSQCFLKSEGKLRCTTCHDPHDLPRGQAAATHYNAVCRDCHAAAIGHAVAGGSHPAGDGCVTCHMPKRRTDDAVHIVMTDHYIQRRIPAGDGLAEKPETHESAANSYRGEVIPYYPAHPARTSGIELDTAMAQITDQSNLKEGLAELAALIGKYHPARAEYYAGLAQGYRAAGDLQRAVPAFEEAARWAPGSPIVAMQLGNALLEAGQPAKAEAVLRRATQLAPGDAAGWALLGRVLLREGRGADARAALEKASALDPELPDPHNDLGALLVGAGDWAGAEREFRAALRIEPGIAEWQSNLANLLASRGRLDEARFHFERSIRLNPGYAAAHLGFGRLLANTNQLPAAAVQAQAAVEADPNLASAHELWGYLLAATGDRTGATRELQTAVRLEPGLSRAQLQLGALLAAGGDTGAAVEHLNLAAQSADAAVKAEALRLLHGLGR